MNNSSNWLSTILYLVSEYSETTRSDPWSPVRVIISHLGGDNGDMSLGVFVRIKWKMYPQIRFIVKETQGQQGNQTSRHVTSLSLFPQMNNEVNSSCPASLADSSAMIQEIIKKIEGPENVTNLVLVEWAEMCKTWLWHLLWALQLKLLKPSFRSFSPSHGQL